jgi:CRP/FNR family transcriptional regulator, cyclic AMP receptor protein
LPDARSRAGDGSRLKPKILLEQPAKTSRLFLFNRAWYHVPDNFISSSRVTFDKGSGDGIHLLIAPDSDKNNCMDQDPILKTLQRIPWFHELNLAQMEALSRIACLRDMIEEEVLFSEGDGEDCLYVLIEGQLRFEAHVPGHGQFMLYTLEPLDIVGWSVLTPVVRQRTGTITAITPSELICFNSKILRQLCDEDHDFGFVIMRRVANVVASRMLVTRLRLFELLHKTDEHSPVSFT